MTKIRLSPAAIWTAGLVATSIALMPFDIPFAQAMRNLPDSVRRVFDFITVFGESGWYLLPAGLLTLAGFVFTNKPVLQKIRFKALFLFSAVAVSGLATDALKILFGKARPKIFFDTDFYGFKGPAGVSHWPDYASYPSGHATTAIAAGLALAFIFPHWRKAIFPAAILVAISRPVITAHWISDIPAGAAVAVAITCGLYSLFIRKELLSK